MVKLGNVAVLSWMRVKRGRTRILSVDAFRSDPLAVEGQIVGDSPQRGQGLKNLNDSPQMPATLKLEGQFHWFCQVCQLSALPVVCSLSIPLLNSSLCSSL